MKLKCTLAYDSIQAKFEFLKNAAPYPALVTSETNVMLNAIRTQAVQVIVLGQDTQKYAAEEIAQMIPEWCSHIPIVNTCPLPIVARAIYFNFAKKNFRCYNVPLFFANTVPSPRGVGQLLGTLEYLAETEVLYKEPPPIVEEVFIPHKRARKYIP